jgi:hypothetical protein
VALCLDLSDPLAFVVPLMGAVHPVQAVFTSQAGRESDHLGGDRPATCLSEPPSLVWPQESQIPTLGTDPALHQEFINVSDCEMGREKSVDD